MKTINKESIKRFNMSNGYILYV
ncbi:hypothetical protein C5167_033117 [Papaver somniferum]|uniref:Uncharacterized protein n=1 Tax=Papaver somniferum TaxID=3469 RepID=A0A4Y7KAS8_PAPSO|nr:hypothetical protein C5167_033117 [Papaver somniferum]